MRTFPARAVLGLHDVIDSAPTQQPYSDLLTRRLGDAMQICGEKCARNTRDR
jgi:hypothetical protein